MTYPSIEDVLRTFDYHKPSEEQIKRISDVRLGAKLFVMCIQQNVKGGPDRTVAFRYVHEAMMTANKAIVTEEDNGHR